MSLAVMRHDPSLGHTYIPNLRTRIATGGGYLLQTNGAGFRSHREFVAERSAGTKRVLVFGDSQSAGDGVSNARRWTDQLEDSLDNVEIDNHCVSGTGTDQQFLTWRANASREHDLVVVAVYLENIRRNVSRVVRSVESGTDRQQFTPKPYFTADDEGLALHHVPVPRNVWTADTVPDELAGFVYPPVPAGVPDSLARGLKPERPADGRMAHLQRGAKSMLMRAERFRPLRAYDDPADPAWLLLRAIVSTWAAESEVPLLIVPLPHYFFVSRPERAQSYQERFAELSSVERCFQFDPLPHLSELPVDQRRSLWSDAIGHLSAAGHAMIADLLQPQVESILSAGGARRKSRHQRGNAVGLGGVILSCCAPFFHDLAVRSTPDVDIVRRGVRTSW